MKSHFEALLIFSLSLFCANIATAQPATKKITDNEIIGCSLKANSIERLTCFDELAKRLGPPSEVSTKNVGEWRVSSDVSKFDDTKSVYLLLRAKNEIMGWPRKTYTPELTIRCREKKTEAYITFGMSPTIEYGLHDAATLQFRIDKQAPFKAVGGKSTDGEALFLRDTVTFVKRLYKANELLVRFIPFNSSAQETSFNVSGLEQAIVPLAEACRWSK